MGDTMFRLIDPTEDGFEAWNLFRDVTRILLFLLLSTIVFMHDR